MLNNQKGKLGNYLEVSNRTNHFQIQVVIERGNPLLEPIEWSNPLLEPTQESRQVEEKRPVLRRSKHVLFMKKLLKHDGTGQPVVSCHTNNVPSFDCKSLNVDMCT